MIKKVLIGICLMVSGVLAMISCTKNNENTIILIGTEGYIKDILEVIPDSLQTKFFAEFGNIPEGPVPPRLDFNPQDSTKKEASYVVDPRQRVYSNVTMGWPLDVVELNAYIRFFGQHNGIVGMEFNDGESTLTDTVYVCGKDNDFAVYFIEEMAFEVESDNQIYSVKMERGVIMKGRVTDAGLADFRYATIVRNKNDEMNLLPEVGSYYIYKDGNGIAERIN